MKTLTAPEVIKFLSRHRDALLLDVSLAEDYRTAHLPGALNAAVYEVTFLDQVQALREGAVDRDRPVIVYGSSVRSLASATAAAKLEAAGFVDVRDFRGGLEAWQEAGHTLAGEGHAAGTPTSPADGTRLLDLEASQFEWTGRSLGGKHSGTLKISTGEIDLRGGHLVGGRITIDIASMENTDIPDAGMRQLLIDHLLSEDFFEVKTYSTAIFEIVSAETIPGAAVTDPNLSVRGRLRLKGAEHLIEFRAVAGVSDEGVLTARANFDIDRTLWNVTYGSGKFYEKLGRHAVNDLITIDLKIVAG